jgi:glycosyltransferase involved in cell wall biosynthesis
MLDKTALIHLPRAQGQGCSDQGVRPAARQRRVVLIQTQAEGAGAQEVSRILGNGLEQLGFDVHYVFFFRRTAAFDGQKNTFFCTRTRPSGLGDSALMLAALLRHLRTLRPDAALCFQHYGNIVGGLAARAAGVRNVIANRTTSKDLVPRWARFADLLLGLGGVFDRVVVNSRTVEAEYARYARRYRRRVVRIEHGFEPKRTDFDKVTARRLLELPADAVLLGSVARLHPGKNLAAAIRLLTLERTWHLAIAGQGEALDDLRALTRSLGVTGRVHFLGELPPSIVALLLGALDVFVFPSLAETFGLAAVEAAQAGVPVVANDLPVLREVLAVDGEPCAQFVDVDDTALFAATVRRVLHDQELRSALILRGAALSERYSLDEMVGRYAALIR